MLSNCIKRRAVNSSGWGLWFSVCLIDFHLMLAYGHEVVLGRLNRFEDVELCGVIEFKDRALSFPDLGLDRERARRRADCDAVEPPAG